MTQLHISSDHTPPTLSPSEMLVAGMSDAENASIPAGDESGQAVQQISRRLQVVNLLGVIVPFAGLLAVMFMLWGIAFSWVYLALLIGMYIATGLGITIGYHRLFTHKSFSTYKPISWLLAVLGTMAAEGGVLEWVSWHRAHHQHSDRPGDPHSPHVHDHPDTIRGTIAGFFHAHFGWFIRRDSDKAPSYDRYIPDLKKDRVLNAVTRQAVLWIAVGLLIPAVIGGLLTQSWMGVLLGFLWGGLVRTFLVHHVTWSINSVCHIWGSKDFKSHDESRNNALFAILGFGEGWHNNHHAFPASARHGLKWWQFDSSWLVIRAMELTGLAWDVRVPSAERMLAKAVK